MEREAVNLVQADLFSEFDAGFDHERGAGCIRPIGRRTSTLRRVLRARPRRPSTAAMLGEIRALLQDELGNICVALRRIDRGALTQLQFQEVTNDQLGRVLERLVRIERHLDLVESPEAPRISRRRPLAQ
jgi:hypothetical protein